MGYKFIVVVKSWSSELSWGMVALLQLISFGSSLKFLSYYQVFQSWETYKYSFWNVYSPLGKGIREGILLYSV